MGQGDKNIMNRVGAKQYRDRVNLTRIRFGDRLGDERRGADVSGGERM